MPRERRKSLHGSDRRLLSSAGRGKHADVGGNPRPHGRCERLDNGALPPQPGAQDEVPKPRKDGGDLHCEIYFSFSAENGGSFSFSFIFRPKKKIYFSAIFILRLKK